VGSSPTLPIMRYTIRSLTGTAESGIALGAFADCLSVQEGNLHEPVITWTDRSECCAVDVDFLAQPPTTDQLIAAIGLVSPKPVYAWITHGGGLRFIYFTTHQFTAEELGSVAVIWVSQKWFSVRCELKKDTRHPRYIRMKRGTEQRCSEVFHSPTKGQLDLEPVKRWLNTYPISEEEINDYLTEKGMEIGHRYDHSYCPLRPSLDSGSKRSPVNVFPDGIHCYYCAGKYGYSTTSYQRLIGNEIPDQIKEYITNFTHWEHARFRWMGNLHSEDISVGKLSYSAALKVYHGPEDARIPKVFMKHNLMRANNWWFTTDGQLYARDMKPILSQLPAVQYLEVLTPEQEEKGKIPKLKASGAEVCRFAQTIDLDSYGYDTFDFVRGIKIFGQHLPYSGNKVVLEMPNDVLRNPQYAICRPKYVGPLLDPERELDDAFRILEQAFPKINRNYLLLLIAARGCSEGRIAESAPFLYVDGPTGSAKTTTVDIAAAIIGDGTASIMLHYDINKTREGIHEAKTSKGDLLKINEIEKQANRTHIDVLSAMDDLLNLTPESMSHRMYIGQIPLGRIPVIVWTDQSISEEILKSGQIGRRMIHVHLTEVYLTENGDSVWKPLVANTIQRIELLRTAGPEWKNAADTIVSYVIDRWFSVIPSGFEEIARSLGFGLLSEVRKEENAEDLLELFLVACNPVFEADATTQRRLGSRGWHKCPASVWDRYRDKKDLTSSRWAQEQNWKRLLNTDEEVVFESRAINTDVYIRFVVKKNSRVITYVNGEIPRKNSSKSSDSDGGVVMETVKPE
jgi:hypothetical protein